MWPFSRVMWEGVVEMTARTAKGSIVGVAVFGVLVLVVMLSYFQRG